MASPPSNRHNNWFQEFGVRVLTMFLGEDAEKSQLELKPLQATEGTRRGGGASSYTPWNNDADGYAPVAAAPSDVAAEEKELELAEDDGGGSSDWASAVSASSSSSSGDGSSGRPTKDPLVAPPSPLWSDDWWFPPHVPPELQLLRLDNLAMPACYVLVGTLQGLFKPLLNVYPLDLGASEAQQTTVSVIATLPCAFKIVFGFVSDNYPLLGLRRKPYLAGGWIFASLSLWWLIWCSDLTLARDDERGTSNVAPFHAYNSSEAREEQSSIPLPPSIPLLSLSFFLFGIGLWFADVMADALVAEKSRLEPDHSKGTLQATCYSCRFFAQLLSASATSYLYSRWGPALIVKCLTIGPLVLLPLIYRLKEVPQHPPPVSEQCREIWRTVCSRAVWQPMSFVYAFNVLQIPNAAWRQFLKSVWHFSASQLNGLLVASYGLLYLGITIYKYCCMHASWRRTYRVCISINAVASSLQLLLIRGHTFGLSPYAFALGDEAVQDFIVGLQFLPCAILMVALCPAGSEGASYAMFTTVWNNALMLSPALSTALLRIWDVSKETLEAGELNGMFRLTVLTTLVQLSPIVLVGWLPHGRNDLLALNDRPHSGSAWGGGFFLLVLAVSMLYTLAATMLNVLRPGWSGES